MMHSLRVSKRTLRSRPCCSGTTSLRGWRTVGCQSRDLGVRVLLQKKIAAFGIPCENMCKEMGVYPKCQCPGFAGMPASADDNRACIAKYCQDPSSPCPNDAFVTCVKENTEVSALQWPALLMQLTDSI